MRVGKTLTPHYDPVPSAGLLAETLHHVVGVVGIPHGVGTAQQHLKREGREIQRWKVRAKEARHTRPHAQGKLGVKARRRDWRGLCVLCGLRAWAQSGCGMRVDKTTVRTTQ